MCGHRASGDNDAVTRRGGCAPTFMRSATRESVGGDSASEAPDEEEDDEADEANEAGEKKGFARRGISTASEVVVGEFRC